MASFNFQDRQEQPKTENKAKGGFSYFSINKNGGEAIVRFMYNSPEEFNLFTLHQLRIDGKLRKIDCLHIPYTETKCPLCEAGIKQDRKFFIKLLQYEKDENGVLKSFPKIWERSEFYANTLSNLFKEYGNISDLIFKIKRTGNPGDKATTYDIMYANPAIYKPEIYIKDENAFADFNFKIIVNNKTEDELKALLSTEAPTTPIHTTPNNSTTDTPTTQPTYNNTATPNGPTEPFPSTYTNGETIKPRRTFTY